MVKIGKYHHRYNDWLVKMGLYETRYIIYDVTPPELFEELEHMFKVLSHPYKEK